MSLILNIETSASVCSVALSKDGEIIDYRESAGERAHATRLTPFIDEILKNSHTEPGDLDAIAVSKGPGSYTGLRIGVSTAKGMAFSLNIPLISIDTMLIMCLGLKSAKPELFNEKDILFCPMADARRMEVYLAVFDRDLNYVQDIRAEIIKEGFFTDILSKGKVVFFGDGMSKCRNLLNDGNSVFIDDFNPLARYLALISHTYFTDKNFVQIAYFEPLYLKDFMASKPKNPFNIRR